jgi:putative acetyltransferase
MVSLRPAEPADHAAIAEVTSAAFGGPAEAKIIEDVRAESAALVDLVAVDDDGSVVGHVLFSRMHCNPPRFFAGLGPVSAAPDRQNDGIGMMLCRAGVEACRTLGIEAIVVLGHTNYYPRFGFSHEAAAPIASPYAASPSFMALELVPGALSAPIKVDYPAAFG